MSNRKTRREVLVSTAGLAAASTSALADPRAEPQSANRLWYRQPAASWTEALPPGNGRLGAMVFGRVGQERLQLNESTLWAGSPTATSSTPARRSRWTATA